MKAIRISSEKYLEYKMNPLPDSARDPTTKALLTPAAAYVRDAKGQVVREWKDRYKNTYALYDDDGKSRHRTIAVYATEAGMDNAVAQAMAKEAAPAPVPDEGKGSVSVIV